IIDDLTDDVLGPTGGEEQRDAELGQFSLEDPRGLVRPPPGGPAQRTQSQTGGVTRLPEPDPDHASVRASRGQGLVVVDAQVVTEPDQGQGFAADGHARERCASWPRLRWFILVSALFPRDSELRRGRAGRAA